jgi:hypothetical protein
MQASLEIIPSYKIDIAKWNACIQNSSNGFIYATSAYLNFMSDNWDGIIVNDYECVMPIPWRKKLGIRYSYDVPFIQQLGWFQKTEAIDSMQIFQQFFKFIKYGDYAFNFENGKITNAFWCNNYVLDLSQDYNAIERKYNTDLINNLKKAYKQELIYVNGEYKAVIDLYKNLYQSRMPHVSNNDFENFKRLCEHLHEKNNVRVRNVLNVKNELLATVLLLKDERRLYNLMNCTTVEGRKTEANHFLFDNILKEFATTNLLFDFEGSDIPGVKNFYEKFGTINQPYCKLHFNNLPKLIKWIKR